MFKKIILMISALTIAPLFSQITSAEDVAAEPATLVVYRSDERNKTKRIKFQLRLNGTAVTQLKYSEAYSSELSPGSYTLDSSLAGSKSITVELKPGQTHYIYTQVDALGSKITPRFTEVEEQVAARQSPSVADTI